MQQYGLCLVWHTERTRLIVSHYQGRWLLLFTKQQDIWQFHKYFTLTLTINGRATAICKKNMHCFGLFERQWKWGVLSGNFGLLGKRMKAGSAIIFLFHVYLLWMRRVVSKSDSATVLCFILRQLHTETVMANVGDTDVLENILLWNIIVNCERQHVMKSKWSSNDIYHIWSSWKESAACIQKN